MAITWPDIPNTEDSALHTYFTEMQTILKKTIDALPSQSPEDISAQIVSSINSAVPKGVIVAWSGAIVDIPSGWALCNGEHDTPDFRDKFIVAAGAAYTVGSSAGASSITPTGTVGATALSLAQIPSHNHVLYNYIGSDRGSDYALINAAGNNHSASADPLTTTSAGSGATHTHSLTINSTSILPPYYALAWIMKL